MWDLLVFTLYLALLCLALRRVLLRKDTTATIRVATVCDEGASTPMFKTLDAACADMFAHTPEAIVLQPGHLKKIPTGLRVHLPDHHEMQIRSRSGLAKRGIVVANSPGTIDADYRDEIFILLHNTSPTPFEITQGARIAQCTVRPVPRVVFDVVESIPSTGRGGFGSTGY